jgi:hypothetical protein
MIILRAHKTTAPMDKDNKRVKGGLILGMIIWQSSSNLFLPNTDRHNRPATTKLERGKKACELSDGRRGLPDTFHEGRQVAPAQLKAARGRLPHNNLKSEILRRAQRSSFRI